MPKRKSNMLKLTPEQAAEFGLDLTNDLLKGDVRPGKWSAVNALSRKVAGAMNQVEKRRARELELARRAGLIQQWHYESLTFRLGNGSSYTPDFIVLTDEGLLRAEEVKGTGGWLNPVSRVKWKAAGERYRWLKFTALVERKKGDRTGRALGCWDVEEYKPRASFPPVGDE